MKEFKGTPGQWEVTTWTDAIFSNVASSIYHQISSGSGYFDDISKRGFAIAGYMNHYDAQLIAASPDLLEALQQLLDDVCSNNDSVLGYRVDEARAAISKALGE